MMIGMQGRRACMTCLVMQSDAGDLTHGRSS